MDHSNFYNPSNTYLRKLQHNKRALVTTRVNTNLKGLYETNKLLDDHTILYLFWCTTAKALNRDRIFSFNPS